MTQNYWPESTFGNKNFAAQTLVLVHPIGYYLPCRTHRPAVLAMVAKSIAQRTVLWRSTWHLMQEYPVRGTGLDQLRVDLPRIAAVRSIGAPGPASAKISKRAHNDLFQFAAELGLIALAFLLWTLGVLVGYERRMLHPDTAPEACFLGSTLIIVISGINLNAMFSFPFYNAVPPFL